MYLYHLTLQPPTSIYTAVNGSFSSFPQSEELVVTRGVSWIELLRLDTSTGKLSRVHLQNFFCIIRSVATLRDSTSGRDLLVLGTDSGKLVVLEWDDSLGRWMAVVKETFGRSGVRRTVAGQHLSTDPQGRALMISAAEKQKLVYLISREASGSVSSSATASKKGSMIKVSSPLEVSKTEVVVIAQAVLDAPYDNPTFVTLEIDTTAASDGEVSHPDELQKHLVYYEVDTGLHQVTRKAVELVDRRANMLVSVPGGEDGPGGVLVCAAGGKVELHRLGYDPVSTAITRQSSTTDVLFVNSVIVRAKGGVFFFLLQTEEGDLIKVTLVASADHRDRVTSLVASYFDTVPVANSMQLYRSGFLFIASEHHSTHRLYQIQSLGESTTGADRYAVSVELQNLALVDQLDNYGMMTGSSSTSNSITAVQGMAHHSRLMTMQRGIPITEVAVSEMPSEAIGVWTLREKSTFAFDSLIVITFVDERTVVLRVGEAGVEEVNSADTLLLTVGCRTISMGQLQDGSLVQVHSAGVRQVRPDGRICEWRTPSGSAATVMCASVNGRQVALGLSSRVLVHLEADQSGVLLETGQSEVLSFDILSLALGPVKQGAARCRHLAMGSSDLVVRIVDCDPGDDHLSPLAVQTLAAAPRGLAITIDQLGALQLHVGLENGVYCQLGIDVSSGALKDARIRYLGATSVTIANVQSTLGFAVMALPSQQAPWLGFSGTTTSAKYQFCPLVASSPLSGVASFTSPQCPSGGFVGVQGSTLRIFMIESISERFTAVGESLPLANTPRKTSHYPPLNLLAIAESDHRLSTTDPPSDADYLGDVGQWSSSIRLVQGMETVAIHHFTKNETITCCSFVTFHDRPEEDLYLAVGVAKDMQVMPRSTTASAILLFRLVHHHQREGVDAQTASFSMSLTHMTPVDGITSAMSTLGGRLLCGVGSALRLYDIGKRQLLRKCEIKIPTFITAISTQGWRIFVGDNVYSLLIYQYQPSDNRFVLIADDVHSRPVTAVLPLDYETVAVADRMGGFAVLRLPARVAEDLEDGVAVGAVAAKREHLYGAPFKLERLVEFYLGDTIMSLSKTTLSGGAKEVILYSTISGALGIFLPLAQRKQTLSLQTLEMRMREEEPATLLGRNHLLFRSYYAAVKSVIDGDLCDAYQLLASDRQYQVATALEMTPSELLNQLEDLSILVGL